MFILHNVTYFKLSLPVVGEFIGPAKHEIIKVHSCLLRISSSVLIHLAYCSFIEAIAML